MDSFGDVFLKRLHPGARVLLIVDGLDECEGSDDARIAMIENLFKLTSSGRIKICVSSRPWNVYKDTFDGCPHLRLEDLTRGDIHRYTQLTLTDNSLFMTKQQLYPEILPQILSIIVERAHGVFLWVYLVVRELLKALRDGCPIHNVTEVLRSIPLDLDDYSKRMLEQMEPRYRQYASRILQIQLCDLQYDSHQADSTASTDTPKQDFPLQLFDLYYLTEKGEPNFVTRGFEYAHFDQWSETAVLVAFDSLERRLMSRTMGLSEASAPSTARPPSRAELVFLHRTVKDFLHHSEAQKILHQHSAGPYDATTFRYHVLVTKIATMSLDSISWKPLTLRILH